MINQNGIEIAVTPSPSHRSVCESVRYVRLWMKMWLCLPPFSVRLYNLICRRQIAADFFLPILINFHIENWQKGNEMEANKEWKIKFS